MCELNELGSNKLKKPELNLKNESTVFDYKTTLNYKKQ